MVAGVLGKGLPVQSGPLATLGMVFYPKLVAVQSTPVWDVKAANTDLVLQKQEKLSVDGAWHAYAWGTRWVAMTTPLPEAWACMFTSWQERH